MIDELLLKYIGEDGKIRDGWSPTNISLLSPFSVLLSPFSRLPSPFSRLRSPFSVLRSPVSVLPSPFSCLRSPVSVLRSPFSVLRSPFSVNSSPAQDLPQLPVVLQGFPAPGRTNRFLGPGRDRSSILLPRLHLSLCRPTCGP